MANIAPPSGTAGSPGPAQDDDPLANPYPGLRPFQADETHLFFGRDAQRIELLRRLRLSRFLAIVGTSGSGKSSLVRAGLLPGLHGGFMAGRAGQWRVADMRPGADPIGNLARALDAPGVLREATPSLPVTSFTEVTLRRSSLGLVQAVNEARWPEADNLLVLVDQFEELFRTVDAQDKVQASDDANAFVKLLLEAVRQPALNVYVVLTMRSDFLGDCARFRDLPEAINGGQYLIPRLTRDQIREAISGPAAVQGVTLSPTLVNRLLADVGESPDQLPILQHALMRTWDHWRDKRSAQPQPDQPGGPVNAPSALLELADYEEVGGMAEALQRHADQVLASLGQGLDPAAAARCALIAQRMFKALTAMGANGHRVRRLARLGDIADQAGATPDEVMAVAAVFRQPRNAFLMPPAAEAITAETYLDIAHESLIRCWHQLGTWLTEEAAAADQYLRVADTARRHQDGRADLWGGPDLAEAMRWRNAHRPNPAWARRYPGTFVQAMDFLDDSHAEQRQQEARRQRNRRVRLSLGGVLLSALMGAALMWVAGDISRGRQQSQRAELLKSDLQMNEPLMALLHQRESGTAPSDLPACSGVRPEASASVAPTVRGDEAILGPYNDRQMPLVRRLCDPARQNLDDDRQYLVIVDLLERGNVPEAARRISDQPGRVAIQANNLLFELAEMRSGHMHRERRRLLEAQADAAAAKPATPDATLPAAGSSGASPAVSAAPATPSRRKSVASPARANGQLPYQHPVHQRIAERLAQGEALSAGEAWLLSAYKAQQRSSSWQADREADRSAHCAQTELPPSQDPAVQLAQEFYRNLCEAALRPDSQLVEVGSGLRRLASDYAVNLLALLTWPAWRAWRWWQKRRHLPIAATPHPLRRALANLLDGALAFALLWAAAKLSAAVSDLLPATWLLAGNLASLVSMVLVIALPLAYLLLGDTLRFKHRRSIGKIAFDLRPLRDSGQELRPVDALRRNALLAAGACALAVLLSRWTPDLGLASDALVYLGLMALLMLPNMLMHHRSWPDRWSHTHVVDADSAVSLAVDRPPRYCGDAPSPAAS